MAKKNLVIVESPTKARTIGRMLGNKYKVVATVGHLRDLPKSTMGVDIENNFEPKYINVRGKGPVINDLRKDAKKAGFVYLATDPDREGEAISWHLCHILDIDPDEKHRVSFGEITKDIVIEAIENPKAIDKNLVDAQQARRILDRIVGYSLSPLLWKKVKAGLSGGRVQSVALKLISEREEEIRSFVPEEYWRIRATHVEDKIEFESELQGELINGKEKKLEISNEKSAKEILGKLDKNKFEISKIQKRKRKRNPYAPYTTSTIQQDAYQRLGFSTRKTMQIAQQLYEGISIGGNESTGLITYMRTDSTRLSGQFIGEAKKYIIDQFGEGYSQTRNYGSKKGAQDAHEAIRPTSAFRSPISIRDYLSDDQMRLYSLIWQRTIASQMKAQQYLSTTIDFVNGSYLFRSNGNVVIFDGFSKVYSIRTDQNILPELEEGAIISAVSIKDTQHFTKPPARYTEASLVKKLEEDGIGRPSTYSSIVQSLFSRNYVEQKQRRFHTTEIGENVNEFLQKYFSEIINEEFTAEMEKELDDIAEADIGWREVLDEFYMEFEKLLKQAKEAEDEFKIKDEPVGRDCPECGKPLVYKHGRNGKFIGCSGFPDCRHTEAIVVDTGVKCPKCEKRLVEKVSRRGRLFYGCEGYPDCDFALWDKPLKDKCPKCDSLLVHVKNRRANEIRCSNGDCEYKRPFKEKKD